MVKPQQAHNATVAVPCCWLSSWRGSKSHRATCGTIKNKLMASIFWGFFFKSTSTLLLICTYRSIQHFAAGGMSAIEVLLLLLPKAGILGKALNPYPPCVLCGGHFSRRSFRRHPLCSVQKRVLKLSRSSWKRKGRNLEPNCHKHKGSESQRAVSALIITRPADTTKSIGGKKKKSCTGRQPC